jgi:hypothetical protein
MNETACGQRDEHISWLAHTAETIMRMGEIAYPHNPQAAVRYAIEYATNGPVETLLPQRPMDTSDIDPETGEQFGVGPEIDPDDELSAECERDLNEQETDQ